jgi:hypothetical protein
MENLVRAFNSIGKIERSGRISLITPGELTREHCDAWYLEVENLYKASQSDPILILHDLRDCGTTPYFRQRAMEIHALARTLSAPTRTAFLVNEADHGSLRTFVNLTGSGSTHRLKIFSDHDEAIMWLQG